MKSKDFYCSLGRDLRYALRALRGSPVLTAVAVVTLAIGSGAATATFAIVNSVLLKPLSYPEADRLVAIWHVAPGVEGQDWANSMLASASMFFTYAEANRVFEHIGSWTPGVATVTGDGEPEEVPRIAVGAGTLEALGVPARRRVRGARPRSRRTLAPLLGRWFGAAEFAGDAAAAAFLAVAALLASYIPARRAATIDPMETLRAE